MQADLAGLHFQATIFRPQRLILDMERREVVIEHVALLPLRGHFVLLYGDGSYLCGWAWPRGTVAEGWQIVNVEETLSVAYLARQLEVAGASTHDGGRHMMVREAGQLEWESHTFVDDMVVVSLGQKPGSIET